MVGRRGVAFCLFLPASQLSAVCPLPMPFRIILHECPSVHSVLSSFGGGIGRPQRERDMKWQGAGHCLRRVLVIPPPADSKGMLRGVPDELKSAIGSLLPPTSSV